MSTESEDHLNAELNALLAELGTVREDRERQRRELADVCDEQEQLKSRLRAAAKERRLEGVWRHDSERLTDRVEEHHRAVRDLEDSESQLVGLRSTLSEMRARAQGILGQASVEYEEMRALEGRGEEKDDAERRERIISMLRKDWSVCFDTEESSSESEEEIEDDEDEDEDDVIEEDLVDRELPSVPLYLDSSSFEDFCSEDHSELTDP